MTVAALGRWASALWRRRLVIQGASLLLLGIALGALIAYQYTILSPAGTATRPGKIDLDEALVLIALFCIGLLVFSWRWVLSQRREVTRRIAAERMARELAHQDSLTGLANGRQFDQELQVAIEAPTRIGGAHAVLLLDLNGFKRVNDVYGHSAGDEVLIHVAMRLRGAVRDGDLVARLGGDGFVILARQLAGAEEATSIALQVIKDLDFPITIGKTKHRVGIAIGIALIPKDGLIAGDIMREADIALHRAKAERGSALRFFEPTMDASIRERELIERELRVAISTDGVRPFFQPLIDLASQRIVGFEALARWTHSTLGSIPPDRFVPVAESCGLINVLTDQLLRQAATAACQWPEDMTLSFNISPLQLKDAALAVRILSILEEIGLSPSRLEVEVTESALVHDLQGAKEALGALRKAGVRIALDDFGTGYSSLYHLRNFKVDKIKIDRSFVDGMQREPNASALVKGLLGLGHGLGLVVTAEGVESQAQASALLAQGCDQAQGYLYGRAMPAAEAMTFIAAHAVKRARA